MPKIQFKTIEILDRYNFLNKNIIKGISKNDYYATSYAVGLLKNRFKEGEKAISSGLSYLMEYLEMLKENNVELPSELVTKCIDIFKDNPNSPWFYQFLNLIDRPIPVLESSIAENGSVSIFYAINILKDRFLKGEKNILLYIATIFDALNIHNNNRLNWEMNRLVVYNEDISKKNLSLNYIKLLLNLGYKVQFNAKNKLEIVKGNYD